MQPTLEVKDLKMYYTTINGEVQAVDDVSFTLKKGEALGLVGESGCGKTSVALSLLKLLPYNAKIISGEILLNGTNILAFSDQEIRKTVRWQRISMVPQAAMNALNPVFKVSDQIIEAIVTHEQVSQTQASERCLDLLKRVGIDSSRANNYPHEFSGGMKQRVMIAMALACHPEIIIADEPTTALDVIVQAQVLKVIKSLQQELDLSMLLISHDLSVVAQTCDKAVIMYAGKVVEEASTWELFTHPLHPYSIGLIGAFPSLLGKKKRLKSIGGIPPNLLNPPLGCRFHPRCQFAQQICMTEVPSSLETHDAHYVSCHKVNKHTKYT
jgi:peptide/nickel transport system ATP-binding protein